MTHLELTGFKVEILGAVDTNLWMGWNEQNHKPLGIKPSTSTYVDEL